MFSKSRRQSRTKVLQMKCNYGKIIKNKISRCSAAARQIPGLNSLFVQVCLNVSVRGKTPIPVNPQGRPTKWKDPLLVQKNAWYGFQEGTQAAKLRPSATVTFLIPCGGLSRGGEGQQLLYGGVGAFGRGQLSPWVVLWAAQSKDHSHMWSTSHGQSSV